MTSQTLELIHLGSRSRYYPLMRIESFKRTLTHNNYKYRYERLRKDNFQKADKKAIQSSKSNTDSRFNLDQNHKIHLFELIPRPRTDSVLFYVYSNSNPFTSIYLIPLLGFDFRCPTQFSLLRIFTIHNNPSFTKLALRFVWTFDKIRSNHQI